MSADTTAAIMSAEMIVWQIEPSVCDTCQDMCWHIEGEARGTVGNATWTTAVAFVSHLSLSQALAVLARSVGRNADKVLKRERAAALIESHPSLW